MECAPIRETERVEKLTSRNHERVGHDAHVVIRDALGGPDGARARVVGQDVEDEALVRVGHKQALGRAFRPAP